MAKQPVHVRDGLEIYNPSEVEKIEKYSAAETQARLNNQYTNSLTKLARSTAKIEKIMRVRSS